MDLEYFDIFESRGSGRYPEETPIGKFLTNESAETTFSDRIDQAEDPVVYKSVRVEVNPESYEQPYSSGDLSEEVIMESIKGPEYLISTPKIGEKQDDVITPGSKGVAPIGESQSFWGKGESDIPPEEGKELYPGNGDEGAFKDGNGMNYKSGEAGDEDPGEDIKPNGNGAPSNGAQASRIPWLLIGGAAAAYFLFLKK